MAVAAEGEVSRVEWLTDLTETFSISVAEDNYPDNYFSDIDSSSEYYYVVMLATEFGLVDVEAGGFCLSRRETIHSVKHRTLLMRMTFR